MFTLSVPKEAFSLILKSYKKKSPLLPKSKELAKNNFGNNPEELAKIYSSCRGNPSLLVGYDNYKNALQILSHHEFTKDNAQLFFPSDEPKMLMGKVLEERLSLMIPDISKIDRTTPRERIAKSNGKKIFSEEAINMLLVSDDNTARENHYSNKILSLLPINFSKERGSILITPLGLERSTELAFGCILEHQNNSFTLASIKEARNLSYYFTLKLVELYKEK